MSSHFYSLNSPGAGVTGGVTKTTTTTVGANVELRVDDGVTGDSTVALVKAIETLENFIITDNAPA